MERIHDEFAIDLDGFALNLTGCGLFALFWHWLLPSRNAIQRGVAITHANVITNRIVPHLHPITLVASPRDRRPAYPDCG